MEMIAVGTGRDGTVSLTKWFNDLFELNQIKKTAVHELHARRAYNAFARFASTGENSLIQQLMSDFQRDETNVVIGNGYASILPELATLPNLTTLIHIKRDKQTCIESLMQNAKYNPNEYQGYIEPDEMDSEEKTARVTAVLVNEMSSAQWESLTLQEKLSWYYDYTHKQIDGSRHHFDHYLQVNTADLNNNEKMRELAHRLFGEVKVPEVSKLNSQSFLDNHSVDKNYHHYVQWIVGLLDTQKLAQDPAYLYTYAMTQLETWVGWCESNHENLSLCPANALDPDQLNALISKVLIDTKRFVRLMKQAKKKSARKGWFGFLKA